MAMRIRRYGAERIAQYSMSTSETLVRIGLNWSFPTIQFMSKGLPGKLFFLRKLDLNIFTTDSYVIVGRCQIRFRSGVGRCEASEWTRKVLSIFSHFVRRDTSHLSEAVSGILGRYDHRILDNKSVNYFH